MTSPLLARRSPSTWRRLLGALAPLVALGALGACAPDTEHLEVSAAIEGGSLTLKPSPFSTPADPQAVPEGTFTLVLTLGELADKGTEVKIQQFALVRAGGDQATLLPSIPVQATAPTVIAVAPGSSERHVYTFAYDTPQKIAEMCQGGQVQFTGTVYDGANDKPKPITSTPFSIAGCP